MSGKRPVINKKMIEKYLNYQREQERSLATLQKYKHDLNALMEFLKGKELTKTALISLERISDQQVCTCFCECHTSYFIS